MENLLFSAINNERNENYSFCLRGDLCQMSEQRSFLNSRGIQTEQNDVYPCLKSIDIKNALKLIWSNRVEGWWHYKDEYVEYSICSEEDFRNRLKNY
jgi:hypothetical protein